jgi:primosomal protein N' (replication factor Y)
MPIRYADIAFPTAVRQVFTYDIRDENIQPGMRVWVPLRKEFAIGMVVNVHTEKPSFETRSVERVLDDEPIMTPGMLELTEWIHRFYFCSWGEAIQAALPVGLNFSSEKVLRVKKGFKGDPDTDDLEMLNDIEQNSYTQKDAEKRWRTGEDRKRLKKLMKRGWVTVWEQPRQRVDYK